MSVDAIIEELSAEAREAVSALLRKAYARGYREALASGGQTAAAAQVEAPMAQVVPLVPVQAPVPAPVAAPVEWSGRAVDGREDPEAGEGEPGEEEDDDAEADEPDDVRPILPHATIATLRKRIMRTFDLGRFEIDVVICREGDSDRRQLQNRAKLKLYRRGG